MARRLTPLLALLLFACGSAPVKETQGESAEAVYRQRSEFFKTVSDWDLVGQLSMDDGTDGGSGRLHWRSRGPSSRLDFRGALGRGAWRLSIEPGLALLEKGDGSSARATTTDELIQHEIGWRIPVHSLQWWVLGVAAPGAYSALELDDEGLIRRLEQDGWTIDFERYQSVGELRVPRKMRAASGDYRVKLAVSRWTLDTGKADSG